MIRRRKFTSQILKRSLAIDGHKTSISLESAFWGALKEIAAREGVSVPTLVTRIDSDRQYTNLSSTIRLFVFDYYRGLAEAEVTKDK